MKKLTQISRFILLLSLGIFFSVGLFSAGIYLYLTPKLPPVEDIREIKLQTPLRVYSKNFKLIGEFGEKRRTPVTLDEVPPLFIKAVLAAEDDRFYTHSGVDLRGLMRAVSQLVTSGKIQTGGSTITMQVARNFFLSSKKTFERKFNEILLAFQIERELSKDEILELYVNKIYLGNRAYGVGAAAQVYYGTDVNNLNLAQLAMIAGLPKAPSRFNPLVNPERATIRRNWILQRMLKLGYIDQDQYEVAVNEPISASYHSLKLDLDAPYVAEMARKFAVEKFGQEAYTEGLQIITTVDIELQETAQTAVQKGILAYEKRHGYRGVEQHIDIPQPADSDINELLTDEALRESLLNAIQQIPEYGSTQVAVVIAMDDETLGILIANGERTEFVWSDIQGDLRPYETENRRGPTPAKPADVFKVGDVIRVVADQDNRWEITQLPLVQAALVSLDSHNGAIHALVGGFDFNQSKYNRVIQARRQPGSNFKPFIYTTALENGFTAASLINDAPIVFDDNNLESTWRPENSSGQFYGPTRLRKALYKSRNLVSIRLLQALGVDTAINGAERFGFDQETLPRDLSLALGSLSIPPMEMASGYASFANGGFRIEPFLVNQVLDNEGHEIYAATPLTVCKECNEEAEIDASGLDQLIERMDEFTSEDIEEEESIEALFAEQETSIAEDSEMLPEAPRIIDERAAFIIDSMLLDVVKRGTARKALTLKRNDLAGKTGTTNGPTDAWFSGYHPDIVTTTWLGFDNNNNLGRKEYGGSAALPIWIDFMRVALEGKPEAIRNQPDGLVTIRIDEATGKRASPEQGNALFEIFRVENAPEEIISTHENTIHPEDLLPEDMF